MCKCVPSIWGDRQTLWAHWLPNLVNMVQQTSAHKPTSFWFRETRPHFGFLYSCVIFHVVYVPNSRYPSFTWRACRKFPFHGYGEQEKDGQSWESMSAAGQRVLWVYANVWPSLWSHGWWIFNFLRILHTYYCRACTNGKNCFPLLQPHQNCCLFYFISFYFMESQFSSVLQLWRNDPCSIRWPHNLYKHQ